MSTQPSWIAKARQALQASLAPVPHELNELDWKIALSKDTERITQHLSAFANHAGGGFFVFGVAADGDIEGISADAVHQIVQTLGNLSRDALEPPQIVSHAVDRVEDREVLFVHVPESAQKPVHLRGKSIEHSYIRSAGQTRKMSTQDIANAVLRSRHARYEELEALTCSIPDVARLLDCDTLLQLLRIPGATTEASLVEQLVNHKLLYRHNGRCSITNLGAIAAARDLTQFPGKERFPVRVIKYRGASRIDAETEREFSQGYGVGFEALLQYIMGQLPTSEVIKEALRRTVPVYPLITIREIVANALIHRDFLATGANPMVEIFSDRMEVTNPGPLLPSVTVERLIDVSPESRNELFAKLMRRLGICEERGSGIDRALDAVEVYGLPPVKFLNSPNAFKAILYSPKPVKRMTPEERLDACLQHCCLRHYVANDPMTNASFRKRLGLRDNQYALAWRVIDAAMARKLIKPRDPENRSRKYAAYVPYWA